MSVDIFAIIDHNLSAKNALDLPSIIEKAVVDITPEAHKRCLGGENVPLIHPTATK